MPLTSRTSRRPCGRGSSLGACAAALLSLLATAGALAQAAPATRPGPVTLITVDTDGKPIAGAELGTVVQWDDTEPANRKPDLLLVGQVLEVRRAQREAAAGGEEPTTRPALPDPIRTGADGVVTLPRDMLFPPRMPRGRAVPLYVLDRAGGRVAVTGVSPADADRGEVRVTLRPACLVSGRVFSGELEKLGRSNERAILSIVTEDHEIAGVYTKEGKFRLPLPPGRYGVSVQGSDIYPVEETITVPEGRKELTVELDAPPTKPALMVGKPALELRGIKAWKNSGPVKLADLKGKVVMLDFWGFWCPPCVAVMPRMMELHEKYKGRGLVVLGVHNDEAEDMAELDGILAQITAQSWEGKAIPFAIALDGGGEQPIEGTPYSAKGATTAAYGVVSFPTTLLIDREGRVIKRIEVRDPEAEKEIEAALGE